MLRRRIEHSLLLYCAIAAAIFPLSARSHGDDIRISEVLADPPSGLHGDANGDGVRHTYEDEFVELINTGADTVSLAAWKIGDDDATSASYFSFPAGSSLAPGQLLVLFGGGAPALTSAATFVDDGRIGNGLSNGGDIIILLDAQGDTVDKVDISTWPSDQSLARLEDGSFAAHGAIDAKAFSPGTTHWPLSTGATAESATDAQEPADDESDAASDGQQMQSGENNAENGETQPTASEDGAQQADATSNTTQSTGLFIRQILADPPNGLAGDANGDGLRHTYEDEFVELFYTGADTLAIGGWKLGDDDTANEAYFTFPTDTYIMPQNALVVFGGGQPHHTTPFALSAGGRIGNGLSNGGDTVILLNAQNELVDQVIGHAWPADQSIFRANIQADFAPHTTLYTTPYSLPAIESTKPVENDPAQSTEPPPASSESDPPQGAGPPLNLQLEISEVLADPPDDANGDGHYGIYEDEFVEIFNAGNAVDLSGWRLSDDDTAAKKQFAFPAGTVLKRGAYLVLFGGGQLVANDQKLAFTDDGRIGNGLTNGGDRILLFHADGDTILNFHFSAANIEQSLHLESGHSIPHGRLPARTLYSPGEERPLYQRFSIYAPSLRSGQAFQGQLLGHYADRTDSLDPHAAQWLSTDTSAAAIDKGGKIYGKRPGQTRVEAWFDSLFLAQTHISITEPEPPPNLPPEIVSRPDPAPVYAGGLYRYQVEARDPEKATLVYALAHAPPGFTLHYASGMLSGRAPLEPGAYPIRIEASDGRGGLARQTLSLRVKKRPQLHISEVLADPPPGLRGDANGDGRRHSYEDEFVEILNRGGETVDLSGLRLADERRSTFRFPQLSFLAAGARAVVFGGGAPHKNAHFFRANGRIGDGLGNSRDAVYLLSANGNDTLAAATYNLMRAPRQALVWIDSSAVPHASSGVDLPFSPGRERPVLSGLRLADPYLSMLVGEVRQPTLISHWSDGSEHRFTEKVHWVSSADSVVRVDPDRTLRALSPGHSAISARFDTHSTTPYTVAVHRRIEYFLSFTPRDSILHSYRGQKRTFTAHTGNAGNLSHTWYINGRRSPQRKLQLTYTCCQNRIDTLHIELRRGRELLRRQWLLSSLGADKRATNGTRHSVATAIADLLYMRAYPNPFAKHIHIAFALGIPRDSRLDIYDARGRHVRTLLKPSQRVGSHSATWDGRDKSGQPVASSVYFYRLQHGRASRVGKALRLR